MISRLVAALADAALLIPASALLLAYLAARREWLLALGWALAVAIAGTTTVVAKLVFHACGHAIGDLDVMSPSGHASFATVFYGSLTLLLGAGRPPAVRRLLAAGTALFVVAVGISRVRTWAHTPAEVVIGTAIGLAALGVFAAFHARAGRPALPVLPVGVGFAAALVLLGGLHFSLEHRIGRMARQLSAALDVCSGQEGSAQERSRQERSRQERSAGLRLPRVPD